MKKYILFIFTTIVLIVSIGTYSYSQNYVDRDKKLYYDISKKFFTDYIVLPDNSADSIKVIALFRISYDLLLFNKSTQELAPRGGFYSVHTVDIEFKDETGIIRKHEKITDTVFAKNYDDTKSKSGYIFEAIEAVIPNNNYTFVMKFQGQNVQASLLKTIAKLENVNYFKKAIIGKPVYVDNFDFNVTKETEPFILDSNCSFAPKGARILVPVSFSGDFVKYSYSIKSVPNKKKLFNWDKTINISDKAIPIKNYSIDLNYVTRNKIGLKLTQTNFQSKQNNQLDFGLLNIEFPADKINPGSYVLTIVRDGTKDTLAYFFDVVWLNMPLCLTKPEYAADIMHYILTDDEYAKLKSGSEDEIIQKILIYWQQKDPTPGTTYNEAMAEFFRRTDFAMFNYQTINQKDGAKTERGKIYILYGSPDSSDRTLADDKTIEKWTYNKQKKIFIFETNSNDDFKLVKMLDK